ncbi:MAG: methionine--tRNA ligase [Proteobacteria bacterium]|jgi:methionyl-tRNA synthetase|nr:methionine--tRNA ligase [Pseudomonadota bacterium]
MGRTVYFTTPIYYVNAEPHIGHLYTTVLADTLKRFHKMMGDDVYFLTGTDEHGEKIQQVADKQGITAQALVDRVSQKFQDTWAALGIDNDDFIRTTEPRHERFVREILRQVHASGDIYFAEYTGLYCVGCERHMNLSELVDGMCPDHKTKPAEVKESNYFFRMGKYQDRLRAAIEADEIRIRPERYKNEVLSFLGQKLEDLCISRPKTRLSWGIDLPFDDKFVTYVWYDALLNYPSALAASPQGDLRARYWPVCNHLIAKDILKTHAIYWPTMLMSAGIELPKRLDVHGYWLSGESKMSKSLGNVVRPLEFDERFQEHGGIEALRYFFFREMKFGTDSSFTYELFVERYNAELANGLGNLLSRTASMVGKYLGGALPELPAAAAATEPAGRTRAAVERYAELFEARAFHTAIEDVRAAIGAADVFITQKEPWKLAKQPDKRAELELVLYTALEVVRIAAVLLSPVMPRKCREILDYLGEARPLDGSAPFAELAAFGGLKPGYVLSGEVPKFPRIDLAALDVAASAKATASLTTLEQPIGPEITIDEFAKADLRVGVIREGGLVEGADKLVRLMIDLGEGRLRQIFAGIRAAYPDPAKLVGRKVIVVANLKPRQMKFGLSEGMVLAASGGGKKRLCAATFDAALEPGDKVT